MVPPPDAAAGATAGRGDDCLVAGAVFAVGTTAPSGIQRWNGVRSVTFCTYQVFLAASQRAPKALAASFSANGVTRSMRMQGIMTSRGGLAVARWRGLGHQAPARPPSCPRSAGHLPPPRTPAGFPADVANRIVCLEHGAVVERELPQDPLRKPSTERRVATARVRPEPQQLAVPAPCLRRTVRPAPAAT